MALTRRTADPEAGFTIMELMVVMLIGSILVTLGAFAVRQFWQKRSLQGAQDQVAVQMRQVQQRSMAETYPIVYGIRFQKGTSNWGVVRYNASTLACQAVNNLKMGDGVQFQAAGTDFPDVPTGTGATSTACRNAAPASADYEVVFFYPKGSASAAAAGSTVTLLQPGLPETKVLTVLPNTGRVQR